MENDTNKIKYLIYCKREDEFVQLLRSGLDPNFEGGWPIRLAARYGCSTIVESLIQFGANPHLLSESGASTLQLAVFSGEQWDTDKWNFLLSCCDSSQLADGAAVAVIFNNGLALKKILSTGRCNTNIATTLTGKTLDVLAKGYKLTHILSSPMVQSYPDTFLTTTRNASRSVQGVSITLSVALVGRPVLAIVSSAIFSLQDTSTLSPRHAERNLSPSVARFFYQTAAQTSLSPTRRPFGSTQS